MFVVVMLVMASCRENAKQPVAQQEQDGQHETFYDNSANSGVDRQKHKKQ